MVNKTYTVVSGTFRGPSDKLTALGGQIDLPDDVAERFRHQLVEVKAEAVDQPVQASVPRKGTQAKEGGSA
ncbi:hypothetical protein KW834_13230 [Pseudomonas sp. PDM29]|uniref:hypothetical protein n=1 Tax=Pseudomonas sp. PDM29 TaxID=2854771 RepID=UPI001C43DB59|nr:hypothetical protein [Pseudomonas sp. PDM29]MBV7525372.1 hypothetical protein [Pseudomonas sp. PDM29]